MHTDSCRQQVRGQNTPLILEMTHAAISMRKDQSQAMCRSTSIQEVEIEGGGYYWQGLASALGVSAQDLLYWDKFGRNKELYLKPEDKPDDMDDPDLMVRLARQPAQLVAWVRSRSRAELRLSGLFGRRSTLPLPKAEQCYGV